MGRRCWLAVVALSTVARAAEPLGDGGTGGPHPGLHAEVEVMQAFAPMLWLASDEPTLPMLPHALAFDGRNNFGGVGKDLDNLDELQWDIEAPFEELVGVVDEQHRQHPIRARVLYEAPSLDGGWFRKQGDRYIYALEYWFYYPYDRGMGGGHKGDSEHTFVFVSIDDELEDYRDLLDGRVVAVVGAGHETHTANNVLIAGSNENPRGEIRPRQLPKHMPILVELGKHASAPDRNFDGRFDIGADVNVFRDAAWGSRDIRPSSLFHIIGDFKDWHSLPRDDHDIWFEHNFATPELYGGYRQAYPSRFPPTPPDISERNRYTLFPLRDLACLYQLLGRDGDPIPDCSGSVVDFLAAHRDCFWLDDAPSAVAVSAEALVAMKRWVEPAQWEGDTHHLKLFEHSDARDPNNIFKLHLYPTVSFGGAFAWDGFTGPGPLVQGSVRVAEITGSIFQWFPNSMLELGVSFDTNHWQFYDAELHYLFFRGAYSGFFAGVNFRRERLDGVPEPMDSDDAMNEPGSEMSPLLAARDPLSRWRVGVDVGWAVSFNLTKLQKDLFLDTKIALRADVFNNRPSDIELALGAKNQIRLLVSVGIRRGLGHPLNPLAY